MAIKPGDKERIYGAFILLTIYFIVLAFLMTFQELFDDRTKGGIATAWVIIYLFSGVIVADLSIMSYDEAPFNYTWLNVQLLHFLGFIIIGYMFALKRANDILKKKKEEYTRDFIILQCMMPVVIFANGLNPLPKRKRSKAAIIMLSSLNAFDIMDVLVDLRHVKEMGTGSEVWFYMSVGVSILLLAFPLGLDEVDKNDPEKGRIAKSLATLIFTDISFLVLRARVMHNTNSVEVGLVFAFKSCMSALVNIYLLFCACCC